MIINIKCGIFSDKIEENVATSAGSGTFGNRNQQSIATTGNKLRFYVSEAGYL
jgi:hypothetical protein